MKFEFSGTGTAEDLHGQVETASANALLEVGSADEHAAVEAAFDAIGSLLTSVEHDRQATVTMTGEVRGTELAKFYLDVTIVPSAAVQEAKAAASAAAPVPDTTTKK